MKIKPWIEGPLELLKHGLEHSKLNDDFNNRIAMISIDNSVELMIKTYLGLPKRINQIEGLSRKKLDEASHSFPSLLDVFETYAEDKTVGIELGDIEWYHRLRNTLYHNGNGITVEKSRVEAYAEIASLLIYNLFEVKLDEIELEFFFESAVGELIKKWGKIERNIRILSVMYMNEKQLKEEKTTLDKLYFLKQKNIIHQETYRNFQRLRNIRNPIVHGGQFEEEEMKDALKLADKLIKVLNNLIDKRS